MDTIVFLILSITYLFLGLLSITNLKFKNLGLKWFVILTILLPLTKITIPFHFKSQISVYYFFFIGVIIIYIKKIFFKKSISKKLFEGVLLIIIFLTFFFIQLYFTDKEQRSFINILKDIKPFIMLILAYLFINYYKEQLINLLTDKFSSRLILFNFIFSSIFFYYMSKTNLHLVLSDDPYFKYEELRYETLGTYFGLFFLLYSIFNNKKVSLIKVSLIIITTAYTGNRTLILSTFLIIVIYYLTKVSLNKILIFISTITIFFISSFYLIINSVENSPLFRFKKMLSIEYVEYALLNRFSPFITAIQSFNFIDFIFGKGFGFSFFIPWFVWRKNIENYNIYIDNLYLTLYAKYGVFFILIFLMLFHYLKSFSNKNTYFLYFLFILIVSITNAMIYQFNFLFLLIVFALNFDNKTVHIS